MNQNETQSVAHPDRAVLPRRVESRRWRRRVCAAGVFGLVLLTGCAYDRTTRAAVTDALREWQRPRVAASQRPGAELPGDAGDGSGGVRSTRRTSPGRAPASDASVNDPNASPAPGPDATIDDYVRAALQHNPALAAAKAEVRAKLARIDQAVALPDPMLRTVTRPEPIQTAAGDMTFTLAVAQTIPWLARLERAGDVAAAEARVALERLNELRTTLVADVQRAWWHVYRLDRQIELAGENVRLLEDLVTVIDTQYQVGRAGQQDLLRAQNERDSLRNDEQVYRLQRRSAAAQLNRLVDVAPAAAVPTTRTIDDVPAPLDADRLVALAGEHNPSLAGLREAVTGARHSEQLARLAYVPDVTLGVEWTHGVGREPFRPPINPETGMRPPYNRASAAGDDNWAITVGVNLPIWVQRIEAAKREARERMLASQRELHAAENDVAYRVFDAWSRVAAARETVELLRSALIPQARQTYDVALVAYQSGDEDFLTLIENWRHWLALELMLHRETAELHAARAELEQHVGVELVADAANADPTEGN